MADTEFIDRAKIARHIPFIKPKTCSRCVKYLCHFCGKEIADENWALPWSDGHNVHFLGACCYHE